MSLQDMARWTAEQAVKQAKTTYLDYKRVKSFEDVGFLLEDYVIQGGEVNVDVTNNNVINVSDIVANLNNNIMTREGVSFKVDIPNTTYYLDFTKEGDFHFSTTHAAGIVSEDYLTVAILTTDINSNIDMITDERINYGGTRFKSQFGLEQYAEKTELQPFEYLAEKHRNVLTVAKHGGQFETINDAIDFARGYCSPSNRVTIRVHAGTYEEEVILTPNPGIDIVGDSPITTYISYNSVYPNSPIFTIGTGSFSNLSLYSGAGGSSAYAMHYESQGYTGVTGVTEFRNCNFVSMTNTSVGIGLGQDCTLRFIGCEFNGVGRSAFYFHNFPANNVNRQYLEVRDCYFNVSGHTKCIDMDDAAKLYGFSNSSLVANFTNCNSNVPYIHYRNGSTNMSYVPVSGSDIFLGVGGTGNNILGIDSRKRELNIGGIIPVGTNGTFTLQVENANQYDYKIVTAASSDGSVNIMGQVSYAVAAENYVVFTTTYAESFGNSVNINIKATAK